MQHKGMKVGPVDSARQGGSQQRATTREHYQHWHARGCPWLGRGRHEVPWHVRASSHGGVNDAPDGNGRRTERE
jgi:hypothetical protein